MKSCFEVSGPGTRRLLTTSPPSSGCPKRDAIFQTAVRDGCALLDKLVQAEDGGRDFLAAAEESPTRSSSFPQFLPMAKALIFLKTIKASSGVGLHHGWGFIIARLPNGGGNGSPGGCSPWQGGSGGCKYSAPCFVRLEGVELGLLWGVQQVDTLMGVLSDRAFESLTQKTQVVLGLEWNVALWPLGCETFEQPLAYNDVAMARVGRGWMCGVDLAGDMIFNDAATNAACYGEWATPAAILGGDVPPPPAMAPLAAKLREATCCAMAACFEPAWHRHSSKKLDFD